MFKYDPKSHMADEFINNKEIEETLFYAEKNKNNLKLIDSILEKVNMHTENGKSGTIMLNHRETLVLLLCEDKQRVNKIFDIAAKIKQAYYGKRIVLFAPLYLSNYCINDCLYCPYHIRNKKIPRKKLTQEEVQKEVVALLNIGHKRLAIEAGEDPVNNSMEYILECIETIYNTWYKNGNIRRVNVNIAATSHKNYDRLKQAKIGTYILFQETYNKEKYINLHPSGPKSDYNYHTQAMDRAIESGINDIGLGVLFGLNDYKYDLAGLIMHAEHLEAVYEIGPHTISLPRIKKADGINPNKFNNGIDDKTFEKIIACIRLSLPYTGIIISTRESQQIREKVLNLGVTQISAASRTSVGGYTQNKHFIVADLISSEELTILIIPIDESAPKNRLILAQQQVMRELLDNHLPFIVCQPEELSKVLKISRSVPKLIITDSQKLGYISKIIPENMRFTSFSILFARYKGVLPELLDGLKLMDHLKDTDRVLISEACTHNRLCNDIGSVKLPNWIRQFCGANPNFDFTSGRNFPQDLTKYRLIIHCGACMLNAKEMKFRLGASKLAKVPIINYGIAIAHMNGTLKRSIKLLPELKHM